MVYLPCLFTYMPQGEPPPVAPLPAAANGYVTYGSFNNAAKLSPQSLALWSRLLVQIPDAQMLFKAANSAIRRPASA